MRWTPDEATRLDEIINKAPKDRSTELLRHGAGFLCPKKPKEPFPPKPPSWAPTTPGLCNHGLSMKVQGITCADCLVLLDLAQEKGDLAVDSTGLILWERAGFMQKGSYRLKIHNTRQVAGKGVWSGGGGYTNPEKTFFRIDAWVVETTAVHVDPECSSKAVSWLVDLNSASGLSNVAAFAKAAKVDRDAVFANNPVAGKILVADVVGRNTKTGYEFLSTTWGPDCGPFKKACCGVLWRESCDCPTAA